MTYFIVFLAVLSRFAPHAPNFSPVYGALLFGGARLKDRDSVWFPVALLAVSDLILTLMVYRMQLDWSELIGCLGFASVALIGRWLRNRISVQTVMAASLAGPTAFFFISNFGVWFGWRMYPPTWAGLLACYVAALPFFRNSLLSGLLYSGLLFGAYEIYRRKFAASALRDSTAHAG